VTIDGAEMVEIPKFWFKITKDGDALHFQIATYPAEGFLVSPAHMDREDGVGERDYVYMSRYFVGLDCISKPNTMPGTVSTKHGSYTENFYHFDFAMFWTTRLLYIVEFANWDSQNCIGYGGGGIVKTGYTDTMPYHTGTMLESRTQYGASTQYRYMEGLWDNVYYYPNGIKHDYLKSGDNYWYYYIKITNRLDNTGYGPIYSRPNSGYIKSFTQYKSDDPKYAWAWLPTTGGSESTCVPDYYQGFDGGSNNYSSLLFGFSSRYAGDKQTGGMFHMQSTNGSSLPTATGYRSIYLPSI
jgi:hypothetical protein